MSSPADTSPPDQSLPKHQSAGTQQAPTRPQEAGWIPTWKYFENRSAATVATWWLLLSLLSLVICALYAGCSFSRRQAYQTVAWCLAIEAAGATLGFLFGVPKSNRQNSNNRPNGQGKDGAPPIGGNASRSLALQPNTNLEEISDWLTRMLVGVGLVELKNLPQPTLKLAMLISAGLGAPDGAARGFALAILILFSSLGFLFGTLTTRLYLQQAFLEADQRLDLFNWGERLQPVVVDTSILRREEDGGFGPPPPPPPPSQPSSAAEGSDTSAKRPQTQRHISDEELKLWNSDPNQGKFGGSNFSNGRQLVATLIPALGPTSAVCQVRLRVASTDPTSPLRGTVMFHLHPTFSPQVVPVPIDPVTGVAELLIVSWGRFTVGAECDGGATRLELNLGRVPGGTTAFYSQ